MDYRQINHKGSTFAFFALYFDAAFVFFDDAVTDAQPQTGAFADGFGGKKRLEQPTFYVFAHAFSGVGYSDRDLAFVFQIFGFQRDSPVPLHGLQGIVDDVEKYLVDFAGGTFYLWEFAVFFDDFGLFLDLALQDFERGIKPIVQIYIFQIALVEAAEIAQAFDDADGALHTVLNAFEQQFAVLEHFQYLLAALFFGYLLRNLVGVGIGIEVGIHHLFCFLEIAHQVFHADGDEVDGVVDFVGNTGGELAERSHFFAFYQFGLRHFQVVQ